VASGRRIYCHCLPFPNIFLVICQTGNFLNYLEWIVINFWIKLKNICEMASREFNNMADHYTNPELKRIFRGHKGPVNKVGVHPQMKNVASCSADSTINVWQFKPDMRPYRFNDHSGQVYTVNYNPKGTHLVSAGADKKIVVWKNHPDAPHFSFKAHSAAIRSVTFSQSEEYLLSCSDDKSIKVWDIKIAKKKSRFLASYLGHNNWVRDARFSPDNRIISSICDKSVRLWDFQTQKEFLQYKDNSFNNREIAFHPDGSYLAVGGHSKHLKIWDTRSHRLMQDYVVGKNINSIDWHPTGNYLACATDWDKDKNDPVIHIYDIR
jgi:centriolar protein POC1